MERVKGALMRGKEGGGDVRDMPLGMGLVTGFSGYWYGCSL